METIEIIIYTGVALIVIGLSLNFVIGIDGQETLDSFRNVFGGDSEDIKFERVDALGLVEEIYQVWEKCGKGEIELSQTVYLDDSQFSEISKGYIFSKIRQINYCSQLQSEEFSCGSGEDLYLNKDVIEVPSIIQILCKEDRIELIM